MKQRLFSTCQQADGHHWLLMRPDGLIISESKVGFPTRDEALLDLGVRNPID